MANPDVPRKAAPLHGVGGGLRWPSPSLPLSGERLPVRRASHTDAALQSECQAGCLATNLALKLVGLARTIKEDNKPLTSRLLSSLLCCSPERLVHR